MISNTKEGFKKDVSLELDLKTMNRSSMVDE